MREELLRAIFGIRYWQGLAKRLPKSCFRFHFCFGGIAFWRLKSFVGRGYELRSYASREALRFGSQGYESELYTVDGTCRLHLEFLGQCLKGLHSQNVNKCSRTHGGCSFQCYCSNAAIQFGSWKG